MRRDLFPAPLVTHLFEMSIDRALRLEDFLDFPQCSDARGTRWSSISREKRPKAGAYGLTHGQRTFKVLSPPRSRPVVGPPPPSSGASTWMALHISHPCPSRSGNSNCQQCVAGWCERDKGGPSLGKHENGDGQCDYSSSRGTPFSGPLKDSTWRSVILGLLALTGALHCSIFKMLIMVQVRGMLPESSYTSIDSTEALRHYIDQHLRC